MPKMKSRPDGRSLLLQRSDHFPKCHHVFPVSLRWPCEERYLPCKPDPLSSHPHNRQRQVTPKSVLLICTPPTNTHHAHTSHIIAITSKIQINKVSTLICTSLMTNGVHSFQDPLAALESLLLPTSIFCLIFKTK